MRRILLAPALLLAVASLSVAGIPTKFYYIPVMEAGNGTKYLTVRAGKLSLVKEPEGDRHAMVGPSRWYVLGTQIKSSEEGLFLAYDATGEDDHVSLVTKPDGTRTEWVIRKAVGNSKIEARGENYDWATIQAAFGPLKGYFLDVERIEGEPEGANDFRFVLRKKPTWTVEVRRIYTSK